MKKRKKTVNEIKQQNRRILMNDTMMRFPTEIDRCTYECCLFMLTCNCGYSKQVQKYTYSNHKMPENNILGVRIDTAARELVVVFLFGPKS